MFDERRALAAALKLHARLLQHGLGHRRGVHDQRLRRGRGPLQLGQLALGCLQPLPSLLLRLDRLPVPIAILLGTILLRPSVSLLTVICRTTIIIVAGICYRKL